ncbi:MAG: methyltransferase [Myxococcales bacterium]
MTWYTGDSTFDTVLTVALALAAVVSLTSPFVASPYGRFADAKWGFAVDPRLGWFLMELPSSVVFLLFFFQGPHRFEPVPLVFLGIWCVHYANRGFFFPASMRVPKGAKASFGMLVLGMGWVVTSLHGYLNGTFASSFAGRDTSWFTDPRFLFGLALYATSLALNIHSDAIVRNLRTKEEVQAGTKVYRIPQGGLFRWISSPSYLTELTAWAGFAILTWSLAGLFIFAISCANLLPRVFATHRWYKERFPDYPAERKALIPFVL